ncbi:MAG: hypothetical protein PVH61_23315 [Candidatus Aminicenantes bacterium]|jgi:hypothetical protein
MPLAYDMVVAQGVFQEIHRGLVRDNLDLGPAQAIRWRMRNNMTL